MRSNDKGVKWKERGKRHLRAALSSTCTLWQRNYEGVADGSHLAPMSLAIWLQLVLA